MAILTDNPFAVLTFLAAPAVLTNASTVLALGTSNRLARAADRARVLSTALLAATNTTDPATALQIKDFDHALARAKLFIRALRCFYFAAGSFAAGACVSLAGAIGGYFEYSGLVLAGIILSLVTAMMGVIAIVKGAMLLVFETRLALRVLDDEDGAINAWRARLAPKQA